MLNPTKRLILESLSDAYISYTHPTLSRDPKNWANQRTGLDGGAGGFTIDSCYDPKFMNSVLELICDGLLEQENTIEYLQAQNACLMFDELYKKESGITSSINSAWSDDPLALKQLQKDSLNSVLIAKRIFTEETSPSRPQQRQFSLGNIERTNVQTNSGTDNSSVCTL